MGLGNPKAGFNSTSEFVCSGLPWTTSSIATGGTTFNYQFSKITKRVYFHNHETAAGKYVRIGFTKNGVENANYFLVDAGQDFVFDSRVKEIFVRSHSASDNPLFSLFVELTTIDASSMPFLTGSIDGANFWEGIG
jgi:hypothetical protein